MLVLVILAACFAVLATARIAIKYHYEQLRIAAKHRADEQYVIAEKLYKQGNHEEAIEAYKRADELGSAGASFKLALYYSVKMVVTDDELGSSTSEVLKDSFITMNTEHPKSWQYLLKSANAGYTDAEFVLGAVVCSAFYEPDADRTLVCKDGIPYLQSAAQKGDIPAQWVLGDVFSGEEESRVPPDVLKRQHFPSDCPAAVTWYRKAAIQGDPYAMGSIGKMYFLGRCLPQDWVRGWGWMRMAELEGGDYPYSSMHRPYIQLAAEAAQLVGDLRTRAQRQQALQAAKAELAQLQADSTRSKPQ